MVYGLNMLFDDLIYSDDSKVLSSGLSETDLIRYLVE